MPLMLSVAVFLVFVLVWWWWGFVVVVAVLMFSAMLLLFGGMGEGHNFVLRVDVWT